MVVHFKFDGDCVGDAVQLTIGDIDIKVDYSTEFDNSSITGDNRSIRAVIWTRFNAFRLNFTS